MPTSSKRLCAAARTLSCLLPLLIADAAGAGVYRCADAQGHITYSDLPCATGANAKQQTINASPAARGIAGTAAQPANEVAGAQRGASHAGSEKVCPTERDIANLETRATSITLDERARTFMRDEVRRARACAREDSHYTQEDWARVEQGIRDQDRTLERDRADARSRVVDTHSIGASEQEQQRIENDKNRDALRAVARCDRNACWDAGGTRYARSDSGYVGPGGQSCQLSDGKLDCR
ncbi:hypothetical protein GCM10025771_01870 [Niveibacterium umoris]|uniref:DUF4124 domain-containing protein n=1 Tax=Niveibacterium umoris TaxID=1193620 RepID=A0A840BMQ8_9RHOO|nr:DUF4124 domain-containing protein [Niveibacterium umoris]MBB4014270.1 hypothetical protein [Niveibacterium umoris]